MRIFYFNVVKHSVELGVEYRVAEGLVEGLERGEVRHEVPVEGVLLEGGSHPAGEVFLVR